MAPETGFMSWGYTGCTLAAAFGWPFLLLESLTQPALVVVLLVNGIVAANTWYAEGRYCHFQRRRLRSSGLLP